jgi:hypothetical protein
VSAVVAEAAGLVAEVEIHAVLPEGLGALALDALIVHRAGQASRTIT